MPRGGAMRNGVIVAMLHGGASDAGVLDAALRLSRLLNCHIEALHAAPDAYQSFAGVFGGVGAIGTSDILARIRKDIERRRALAHDIFAEWAARNDVGLDLAGSPHPDNQASGATASWCAFDGNATAAMEQHGRLADLIVLSQPGEDNGSRQMEMLEAAIFDTGRPVLCVPPAASGFDPKHIALLWNGSLQSARAAGDAMPILECSERVTVVTAGTSEGADAVDLVERLVSRGIDARTKRVPINQTNIQDALLAAVCDQQAGMVVMGGYGHSRFRELLLGGVTEHMLSSSPVPVLLAH